MGEWTMVVNGHGIHDNGREDDADALLEKFISDLQRSQQVDSVQFTVGTSRALPIPEKVIS